MASYHKWQVGDKGNIWMGVVVPENPASAVAVHLAKSSPLSAKNASLDNVLHLNTAKACSLFLREISSFTLIGVWLLSYGPRSFHQHLTKCYKGRQRCLVVELVVSLSLLKGSLTRILV